MRMTKQRQLLLNVLHASDKPLSAEALHRLIGPKMMDLSTVYRNLDGFHQAGLLGKSVIEGSAYFYSSNGVHHHYMICQMCQTMIPLDCQLDAMAQGIAEKRGFHITHHDMTVYGYCRNCRPKL